MVTIATPSRSELNQYRLYAEALEFLMGHPSVTRGQLCEHLSSLTEVLANPYDPNLVAIEIDQVIQLLTQRENYLCLKSAV